MSACLGHGVVAFKEGGSGSVSSSMKMSHVPLAARGLLRLTAGPLRAFHPVTRGCCVSRSRVRVSAIVSNKGFEMEFCLRGLRRVCAGIFEVCGRLQVGIMTEKKGGSGIRLWRWCPA